MALSAGVLAATALLAFASPVSAERQCANRVAPSFGETVESLAARCGVTPEALRSRNPGLDGERPPIGIRIDVPAPALPSPAVPAGGNRGIIGVPTPSPIVGPRS